MRPRRKIHQLKPIPTNDDSVPANTDSTPMNNDSAMTETKSAALASSPPPPSPPHPPPPQSSPHPPPPPSQSSPSPPQSSPQSHPQLVYSRYAYLCLDPTFVPDPYNRSLRWAYFLEESTARLHIVKVSVDLVGLTNFKFTVAGDMEPAAPEIVQRYASIAYTSAIYRQTYFPVQIPMTEAPVIAAASSSSAYVLASHHNSTQTTQ